MYFIKSLNYLTRCFGWRTMSFNTFFKDFTQQNKSFAVFAGTATHRNTNNDSVLLVLDSSFNPPHFGHLTLVRNSAKYYQSKGVKDLHTILLLAVNNADKGSKPASIGKRMEMMQLFSQCLFNVGFADVSLALTSHAKFVNKRNDIQDYVGKDNPNTKISFLVGFDTLIRIFDPKYYVPQLVSEALETFMASAEFCCLVRDDDQMTIEEQYKYVDDISKGEREPQIPRSWGQRIHLIEVDDGFKSVSSSSIRRAAIERGQNSDVLLRKGLPTNLYEYIIQDPKLFQ